MAESASLVGFAHVLVSMKIVLVAGQPSAPQMVSQIVIGGVNALLDGMGGFVDSFNWLMLSLPAPGEATKPATWFPGLETLLSGGGMGMPGSGHSAGANASAGPPVPLDVTSFWTVAWSIYGVLAGVVVVPIFLSGVVTWARTDVTPRETSAGLRTSAKTLVLVAAGPVLIAFALHLGNLFAVGVAPSGTEFLATPDSVAKLKIGVALAIVFAVLESSVMLVALLVLFAQWLAVFFVVALWPVFIAALAADSRYTRPVGLMGVFTLVGLIGLKCIQAVWLRFLFSLPLDFSATGSLLTVLAVIIGVALGFIGLPIKGTEKVLPQTISRAGRKTSASAQQVISRRTGD